MRAEKFQSKSVPTATHDLPRDVSAAIRFLEGAYAAADVLYRALHRADDVNLEDSAARVLRECIIDDVGRTLDILHALLPQNVGQE